MRKILLISLMGPVLLLAEVMEVHLKWDETHCNASCQKQIARELKTVRSASEIDFKGENGEAVLKWRPNETFRPESIEKLLARHSVKLQSMDVVIRGVVKKKGQKDYYIYSIGDETRFVLTPQAQAKDEKQKQKPINTAFIKDMDALARTEKVLTITGSIELPFKHPNILQVSAKKQKESPL